jgi:hypothetical protein
MMTQDRWQDIADVIFVLTSSSFQRRSSFVRKCFLPLLLFLKSTQFLLHHPRKHQRRYVAVAVTSLLCKVCLFVLASSCSKIKNLLRLHAVSCYRFDFCVQSLTCISPCYQSRIFIHFQNGQSIRNSGTIQRGTPQAIERCQKGAF